MRNVLLKTKATIAILMTMALLPVLACADDAGVLSESELNTWVTKALQDSAKETPMNAPVGESALTEDGYAYIYSFATFYYNKPVLDDKSVLQAVTLTGNAYATPRGIKLGDDANALVDSFGWQNPMLLGNESFAAFYVLNQLPKAAYWSWVQRENDLISAVRCSIHAKVGENRYTDAGVLYTVENGKIMAIHVYGLNATISETEARRNLNAVIGVQAAITGDDHEPEAVVEGYYEVNSAAPFGANDLLFGGVNYMNFTEASAKQLFGKALNEEKIKDDTGAWLVTTEREGLTLSYTISADEKTSTLDSFSVSGSLKGPRGVQVGMTAQEALKLFNSDGVGNVLNGASVLYGNGDSAPTGLLEWHGDAIAALRYSAAVQTGAGEQPVTLRMTFTDGRMTEWMLYSW